MIIFAWRAVILMQMILLTLSRWICALKGWDENFTSASSKSSGTHGMIHSAPPKIAAEARQQDLSQSPANSNDVPATKAPNSSEDENDFPTWIMVLIIVLTGLVLVACCLCVIRLHRWKRDQGTYSMWNDHQPNLDSMYARESGVLFEKLDTESSLSEGQCYEIPVDSFVTPQRVYICGVRVTAVQEGIADSLKSTEQRMSESAKRMASVDDTDYVAVTDRVSRASDVTSKRESTPNSFCGDVSQHSSVSYSTSSLSERSFPPGPESPSKECYTKPLPVLPMVVDPGPATSDEHKLSGENQDRVCALVNRPLPQTPLLSPPLVAGSSVSLDRSLLKQQKEEKVEKPNLTFRTLPRPKKIRQLHLAKPLFSAIARSASSNDVSKETKMNDHVASDPNDCTLTRMKKRLSQSVDTLLASQRASHFYENPYLMSNNGSAQKEATTGGGQIGTLGVPMDPPYASVSSEEDLQRTKEHLYARISACIDGSDGNFNRHSYASIHYRDRVPSPVFLRPKSRHTYVSIVFGSSESVAEPSSESKANSEDPKSRSCSDLTLVNVTSASDGATAGRKQTKNSYVNVAEASNNEENFPPIRFCPPRNSRRPSGNCPKTAEGIPKVGEAGNNIRSHPNTSEVVPRTENSSRGIEGVPRNGETVTSTGEELPTYGFSEDSIVSDNLVSFPETRRGYENVNEALTASVYQNPKNTPYYQNARTVNGQLYYENVTDANGDGALSASSGGPAVDSLPSPKSSPIYDSPVASDRKSDSDDCHYRVPVTPTIPLKRFREILETSSGSVDDRGSRACGNEHEGLKVNGLDMNASERVKTLSSYLEDRLAKGSELADENGDPLQVTGSLQAMGPGETAGVCEGDSTKRKTDEHLYENFVTANSCVSEESSSSRDRLSSTDSNLSLEEKVIYESQPLIPRNRGADVNGNSVRGGCADKLGLRGSSLVENTLSGESFA